MLASIVAHLLIGLSLAAFGSSTRDIPIEEEPPPRLTIMQLPEPTPPPLVPKNAPMTTVDPSRKSAVAPKEKTFEANENSIAAAEKAATSDNPLPGQDGKDRPFMNLDTHENSFATAGAAPQPKPRPSTPPKKEPTPNETVPPAAQTPAPNELALLTQTPTPIPSPAQSEQNTENPAPTETPTPTPIPVETPPAPASSYRDFQEKTIVRGGITNRGRSAVNAIGTPQGRYKKLLEDAIGARWYHYIDERADLISIGTTSVTFEIQADGSVHNLRMVENTANEASASIALRSIQETKFPPIPDDLLATLPEGGFTMEESFAIFPNR